MKVEVHDIVAECPACRRTDFQPAGRRLTLSAQTPMVCKACGATTTYLQLMMQISDRALAKSADTLAEIKKQRDGTKPPQEPQE